MFFESLDASAETFGAIILPVQYWTSVKGSKLVEGERHLLLAVLDDAVRCYLGNMKPRSRQQRLTFVEARDWFYPGRKAQSRAPISFQSICDLLGIEAEAFRGRLNSISVGDLPAHRRPVRRSPASSRVRVAMGALRRSEPRHGSQCR